MNLTDGGQVLRISPHWGRLRASALFFSSNTMDKWLDGGWTADERPVEGWLN